MNKPTPLKGQVENEINEVPYGVYLLIGILILYDAFKRFITRK